MDSTNFSWKNQRCLVTGAFGFLGTHLCSYLISKGADVVALDQLIRPDGTYFGLLGLERRTRILTADIRQTEELAILQEENFDFVFHLAGQPISSLSNEETEETMEINVSGTANVGGMIALQSPQPVFVFASSACRYGATTKSPLKEDDLPVEGEYKYSESKVRAEEEVTNLALRHDLPTVICRFVNLYGPGDRHFSRIIPKTIRHLIRGEMPCLTRSDGSTILDFMYVRDAVAGLILAAEHGQSLRAEVFNFGVGTENARATIDVVRLVSILFDGEEREPDIENPIEPRTKVKFLDSTKAHQRLGWAPTKEIREGISETIDWYRENIGNIRELEDTDLCW